MNPHDATQLKIKLSIVVDVQTRWTFERARVPRHSDSLTGW